MALDLEIVGVTRPLTEADEGAAKPTPLVRLRDSHHAVARYIARGILPGEISHLTGYALSRISVLQTDPAFRELVEFYRADNREVHREVEEKLALTMLDLRQEIHDRVLDAPEGIAFGELVDAFKVVADRAGYAPVQRSINKNLNLNIGERLDRAREKKE